MRLRAGWRHREGVIVGWVRLSHAAEPGRTEAPLPFFSKILFGVPAAEQGEALAQERLKRIMCDASKVLGETSPMRDITHEHIHTHSHTPTSLEWLLAVGRRV